MIANREPWLKLLGEVEGGFVHDDADPGGATARGVTQVTLSRWRGHEVSIEEVQNVSKTEAEEIALAKYWMAVRGDELPGGLDILVADTAWHSGASPAARILQRVLGVEADGLVGPVTIAAARNPPTAPLLESFQAARLAYLKKLPHWDKFCRGWENRCGRMYDLARSSVRPTVIEGGFLTSKAIWGGTVAFTASLASLGEIAPQLLNQAKISYDAIHAGTISEAALALAGALGASFAIYARITDFYHGKRLGKSPSLKKMAEPNA